MKRDTVAATRNLKEEKGVTTASVKAWQRAMVVLAKKYHREWRKRFEGLLAGHMKVVGGEVAGVVGVSFDLFETRPVQTLMTERLNLLTRVSDQTFRGIQSTMLEGMRAGESTAQLAQRVESVFSRGISIRRKDGTLIRFMSATERAKLIARTEATAVTNGAAVRSAVGSGVETDKEWVTQGDDRVRARHARMEGERVKTDGGRFSNGEDYPGEVNCRCTVIFHIVKARKRRRRTTIRRSAE